LTRITRIIFVLDKSALSVPDTRFSRVSGSTLTNSNETDKRASLLHHFIRWCVHNAALLSPL